MSIFNKLLRIGIEDSDSKELQNKKILLMYLAILMSGGGLVWGSAALSFGLTTQSFVPFGYVVLSILNAIFFYYTKDRKIASRFQVAISLLLPFLFQYVLGGILASGAVMLWGTLSFISALTFQKVNTATFWLFFYILFVVLAGYTDSYAVAIKPEIMPDFAIAFFAVNLSIIPAASFLIVIYFRKRNESTEIILEKKLQELAKSDLINKNINSKLQESYARMRTAGEQLKVKYAELERLKVDLIEMTNKQSDIILKQMKTAEDLRT